jgi:hypothetical protein
VSAFCDGTQGFIQFRIQMQPTTGLDWNNTDRNVWDTGEIDARADEVTHLDPATHLLAPKIERRYSGGWSIYNLESAQSLIVDLSNYYSIMFDGNLIGFCCIGEAARVPGI